MKFDALKISLSDIQNIDILSAAESLVLSFAQKGKTLSSAESCTGGLFGSYITEISGASAVYLGGVISYTNEVKMALLGVSEATLLEHTAVSEFTACEMARGVKKALGSDFSVSVTGYAGPTGGDAKNPVGTVFVCISSGDGERVTKLCFDDGISRKNIREYAVYFMILELTGLVCA